jgi:hypothetical protein
LGSAFIGDSRFDIWTCEKELLVPSHPYHGVRSGSSQTAGKYISIGIKFGS